MFNLPLKKHFSLGSGNESSYIGDFKPDEPDIVECVESDQALPHAQAGKNTATMYFSYTRFISFPYTASLLLFRKSKCHVAPPPHPHHRSHLNMNLYALH